MHDPGKKNVVQIADYRPAPPQRASQKPPLRKIFRLPSPSEGVLLSLVGTTVHVTTCAIVTYYGAGLFHFSWLLALAMVCVAFLVTTTIVAALFDYGALLVVVPLSSAVAVGYLFPPLVDLSITVAIVGVSNLMVVLK